MTYGNHSEWIVLYDIMCFMAKIEDTYTCLFQSGHSYIQSEGKNDDIDEKVYY